MAPRVAGGGQSVVASPVCGVRRCSQGARPRPGGPRARGGSRLTPPGSCTGVATADKQTEAKPMTPTAELLARRNAAVPRGVGHATPVYAARADNAEIWD